MVTDRKCPSCKKPIDRGATRCPHCRTRQPARPAVIAASAGAVLLACLCAWLAWPANRGSETTVTATTIAAEAALSYLADVPGVAWHEVDGNNVYIGFETVPDDLMTIVKAAAWRGSRATNFGFHAWGVSAHHVGWRPGDGPYHGEATARCGRTE